MKRKNASYGIQIKSSAEKGAQHSLYCIMHTQVFQEKYPANKFLKYDEDLVVTIEKETTVLLRAERSDTSCGAAGSWKISATSSTTVYTSAENIPTIIYDNNIM